MFSIRFHSLGREGLMGAPPSVLLPPDLEPMSLDEALGTISAQRDMAARRKAAWTVLRGTPHPPFGTSARKYALRYPAALRYFCRAIAFPLERFDARRDEFRREARLFAGALIAFAQGEDLAFAALKCAVKRRAKRQRKHDVDGGFARALEDTGALGGDSAAEFLGYVGALDRKTRGPKKPSRRQACIEALSRLENEVGISLETYIGEFADTVAFIQTWQEEFGRARDADVTIYPAFTVAAQDPRTLTTMVTATSLVTAKKFEYLARGTDPRNWCKLSSTFRTVEYVDAAMAPKTLAIDEGRSHGPELLHEVVRIHSHEDRTDVGCFDNLLSVRYAVHEDEDGDPKKGWADLDFSLNQSIRSRFLWDERPGGLLIDGGWTKLRSIHPGLWRVTARKVLRFSDRTQQSSWDGPLDFGQALNFLAPSTLSTWLEQDIYGGDNVVVQRLGASA